MTRTLIAIALLVIAACGDGAAPAATTFPDDGVVVVVERGGGLCPQGPCSTTWTVFGDGRVEVADMGQVVANAGSVLGASDLMTLTGAIERWPAELPAFTGTCPAAYDGPVFTYTMGDRSVSSCERDVAGAELFEIIHDLLDLGPPYV